MTRSNGRRVLVTGASRGIGAAIARAVATDGGRLALLARPSAELDGLAAELGAVAVGVDLADPDAARAAVGTACAELGGLDVLVNNAGVFPLGHVRDGDPADWRAMVDLNVLGLLSVTRAAIPALLSGDHPQIVNIGSTAGRSVAHAIQGVYAATKHALVAISDGLRIELAGDGVRVTLVSPGAVHTGGSERIRDEALRGALAKVQEAVGLDPAEVAEQVLHVLRAPAGVHLTELTVLSTRERLG
ncbi:SDR family oxidoreductase [Kitasatospora sp. NPDC097691]|uniref:SDR family oxidoreductase n=1 Tax=Kitasatospora sp. NPDC097691 TaxID=3157231 RepID=UPI0033293300